MIIVKWGYGHMEAGSQYYKVYPVYVSIHWYKRRGIWFFICTFEKVSLRLGSIGAAGTVSLLLTYTVRTVRTLPSFNQRNDIYRL